MAEVLGYASGVVLPAAYVFCRLQVLLVRGLPPPLPWPPLMQALDCQHQQQITQTHASVLHVRMTLVACPSTALSTALALPCTPVAGNSLLSIDLLLSHSPNFKSYSCLTWPQQPLNRLVLPLIAPGASGICLLGIGSLLSQQICTTYYSRLTFHSLPARELILSSFLPVGPMAMTAWAFLNLGQAGGVQLEAYYSQHIDPTIDVQWLHDVAAPLAAAAAAVLALFLWGFATWWLLLALVSVGPSTWAGGAPSSPWACTQAPPHTSATLHTPARCWFWGP
ncbi:voltage-dependent anion channel-domain-containing protein [Scenedesmus sp. NREL 46B-D3]|nr:voltage-dependent anion channel-domain-containing protein [Scenedesmus sp. NREL 46B-D3]